MSKKILQAVPVTELPSPIDIAKQIEKYRLAHNLTQEAVALTTGMTRSWVARLEAGARRSPEDDYYSRSMDPVGCFFTQFCKLYGKEEALKIYKEDWSLYTAERVALYFVYYHINRRKSCDTLGISYTALRFALRHPDRIINKYKNEIDQLFPRIHEDQDMLFCWHLVGRNSIACVRRDTALVLMNENTNFRHKDSPENQNEVFDEAEKFVKWHKEVRKGNISPYPVPASRLSYPDED